MAVAAQISVAEYLSTSYRPDCDYVDGEIEDRNVGERDHSELQMAIGAYLHARRKELGIRVFPEQRIQITPTRFRVPDICVTMGRPGEQIFTQPPFLCIEILSRDDRATRILRRVNDFLRFGVSFIWTIDPKSRQAVIYHPAGTQPVDDGILWTRNPDIRLPFAEIFE